ncbi:hypothetical protein HEP87_63115 [Streptomyces sp. S1D4-11]
MRMDLEELLRAMGRTAANLRKLESVWERARPFIPNGPQRGSHPAFEDLAMAWRTSFQAFRRSTAGPSPTLFQTSPPWGSPSSTSSKSTSCLTPYMPAGEKPGADIAAYRYRLDRARRRAARGRWSRP